MRSTSVMVLGVLFLLASSGQVTMGQGVSPSGGGTRSSTVTSTPSPRRAVLSPSRRTASSAILRARSPLLAGVTLSPRQNAVFLGCGLSAKIESYGGDGHAVSRRTRSGASALHGVLNEKHADLDARAVRASR
jgi:hypothetical protein